MKLLYLYLSEAGPLRDCELNLDSDWDFKVVKAANANRTQIRFSHRVVLPDDMWKIGADKGVESISAIIGDNKAGKTSIAAALSEIYCKAAMVRHLNYKNKFIRYVAVALDCERIKLFSNQPCSFADESMACLTDDDRRLFLDYEPINGRSKKSDLTESLGYVYYNPVVTTEMALEESKNEGVVFWDLSATKGLDRAGTFKKYQLTQRLKVFYFLHDMINGHSDVVRKLGMSLPYQGVVAKSSKVAADFMNWVESRAANDHRYVELRDMMICQEVVVLMLVDYAFKMFCWADVVADKTPDEFGCVDSNCLEEELLSLFVKLGRRMKMTVDTMSKDSVPNDERINCVKCAIAKIAEIAEKVDEDDNQNLRIGDYSAADVKNGLVFFEKYLNALQCHGIVAYPDGLRFSMSEKLQIDCISELLIADKNGYVELGYSPCLSSGEMSYFTALASFFGQLSQKGKKGDKRTLPKDLLIFLDEVESSLHPELQRRLIWVYNIFLSRLFPEKKIHMIFASHSPQLLSDLPKGNVVFIQRNEDQCSIKEREEVGVENTFGANVYDLYGSGFVLQNGPVGEFARAKINEVLGKLAKDETGQSLTDDDKKLSTIVGDSFIRKYIESCIGSH